MSPLMQERSENEKERNYYKNTMEQIVVEVSLYVQWLMDNNYTGFDSGAENKIRSIAKDIYHKYFEENFTGINAFNSELKGMVVEEVNKEFGINYSAASYLN